MTIRRIVPNLKVTDTRAGHEFYVDLLGLEQAFSLGWITGFRSPEHPQVQLSLVSSDATAPEDSVVSVDVGDVDSAYARARELGYEIVHPLTDEPWGVRRFFVRDPHGHVVNVVGHPD
jgi:catechol 2,3-dioxygenase-like lactoylglutathione lyase family enzyme